MRMVYELSNDPDVRKVSIHKNEIQWSDHVKWYNEKMGNKNVLFLIAYTDENPFSGQVRFEIDFITRIAVISISIISGIRGKGYGANILSGACSYFRKLYSGVKIKAYIAPANVQSVKLFTKSGFTEHEAEKIDNVPYKVYML